MAEEIRKASMAAVVSAMSLVGGCAASGGGSDVSRYTKIDDMEGGGGAVVWASPNGPSPLFWSTSTDCTQAERLSPLPDSVAANGWSYAELPAPIETLPGITSTHAARMRTTSPLTGVWGAGIDLYLAETSGFMPSDAGAPAGQPCRQESAFDFPGTMVDLSRYRGVTFWARAATPGANVLKVRLQDRNTDPRGGLCNAATPGSEAECYNTFGSGVVLNDTFTRYTVEFSSMTQVEGWGFHPDPAVVDLAHVYVLIFQFLTANCGPTAQFMCAGGNDTPLSFDLWVDDLYFVNK